MITITIPGVPIAMKRARTFRQKGKTVTWNPLGEEKKRVFNFIGKKVREFFDSENKEIQMKASKLAYGAAYRVSATFYLPIKDKAPLAVRNLKLWGITPPTSKPDIDNYLKFYLDAANEILFNDDSMIIHVEDVYKVYSDNPRTELKIMAISQPNLSDECKEILKLWSPQDFKDFLDDIYAFQMISAKALDDHTIDGEGKERYLTEAMAMIAEFSGKYAEIIKKTAKFKGFGENLKAMTTKFKEAIEHT